MTPLRVLGICGGLQMLGERIEDEAGVDGTGDGLGLLPLHTTYEATKLTDEKVFVFSELPELWSALSGCDFRGYQIRHGRSVATGPALEAVPVGAGYASGAVLAVQAHGMLEEPSVLRALFGAVPQRPLDAIFEELADAVDEHLDVSFLLRESGIA